MDTNKYMDGIGLLDNRKLLAGKRINVPAGYIVYPKDYPNSPAVFCNRIAGMKLLLVEPNFTTVIKNKWENMAY